MIFCNNNFILIDPSTLQPTLWIGTSLGSVLTISITLPDTDNRKTNPVVVSILGAWIIFDFGKGKGTTAVVVVYVV